MVKTVLGAICSLFIPGLGQLFYGELCWAVFWLVLGLLSCGAANILSAVHVFFVADNVKTRRR